MGYHLPDSPTEKKLEEAGGLLKLLTTILFCEDGCSEASHIFHICHLVIKHTSPLSCYCIWDCALTFPPDWCCLLVHFLFSLLVVGLMIFQSSRPFHIISVTAHLAPGLHISSCLVQKWIQKAVVWCSDTLPL